jgi:hypothetical protein
VDTGLGERQDCGVARAPWLLGFAAYGLTYAAAVRLSWPQASWPMALRSAAIAVLPEILLAPLVLRFTRWTPWNTVRLRVILWHLLAALGFVTLAIAGMIVGLGVEGLVTSGKWLWPTSFAITLWRGVMSLVVFCALAAIGHAQGFARRERLEAERAARAETLRAEARLAALRAQLNPHFILNLLHSFLGLVSRDPPAAAAGIERLGDLLRHTLRVQRQDGDQVALRDELKFVEDYLALERLRLGDRLRVHFDVDSELLAEAVPAFVLQPLVENAVRYAVAPRAEGGSVRVEARGKDGAVRLIVADDGPTGAAAAGHGTGVGLRLIRERLEALYGDAATLRAGPDPRGGFIAEVSLPRGEERP